MTIRTSLLFTAVLALSACTGTLGGTSVGGPDGDEPSPLNPAGANSLSAETIKGYQNAGLIAVGGPFPIIGDVSYFATSAPDSTLVLLTASFANHTLSFVRDNDQFRAEYETRVEIKTSDGRIVGHTEGSQVVRVASYQETARSTESVIFQANLKVPPGTYQLTLYMHDMGSVRAVTRDVPITVPRLDSLSLSSPIAVYQATPRTTVDSSLRLVVNPRSTAIFGRDSSVDVYIEGYGAGESLPLNVTIEGDSNTTLWHETVTLPRKGALFSGVAVVPVSRIGIGSASLVFRRAPADSSQSASASAGSDSVRTPVFVGFGEDLPVVSFGDMLNYLKYFPNQAAVDSLRAAPRDSRPAAWARFRRMADSIGAMSPTQSLPAYFTRLRQANERFPGEGVPGWQTDRGMVFITIGDPEQVYLQGSMNVNVQGREQVWVYRRYNVQLVFSDQSGLGRYKLTPRSMSDYQALRRKVLQQLQEGLPNGQHSGNA